MRQSTAETAKSKADTAIERLMGDLARLREQLEQVGAHALASGSEYLSAVWLGCNWIRVWCVHAAAWGYATSLTITGAFHPTPR